MKEIKTKEEFEELIKNQFEGECIIESEDVFEISRKTNFSIYLLSGKFLICGSAEVAYIGGSAEVLSIEGTAKIDHISEKVQIGRINGRAEINSIDGAVKIGLMSGLVKVNSIESLVEIDSISGAVFIGAIFGSAKIGSVRDSVVINAIYDCVKIEKITDSARIGIIADFTTVFVNSNDVTIERAFDYSLIVLENCNPSVLKKDKTVKIIKRPQKIDAMTLKKWIKKYKVLDKGKKLILYKLVSQNFKTQEGTENETSWEVGKVVEHSNWTPENSECGGGKFHAVPQPFWADQFGWEKDDKYIAIGIEKKDCYLWKKDPSYPFKIAFRKGEVLYECDRWGNSKNERNNGSKR